MQKYKLKRTKYHASPGVWTCGYQFSALSGSIYWQALPSEIRLVFTTSIRNLVPVVARKQETSVLEYALRIVF